MKIKLSYLPAEEREAGAAVSALRGLFPWARVKHGEKDGRKRVYIAVPEPKTGVIHPELDRENGGKP